MELSTGFKYSCSLISYSETSIVVEMVLAIPHVRRSKKDYLEGTLRSLISQLSSEERDKVVVVVMVAEPFNSTEFDMVAKMVSQK